MITTAGPSRTVRLPVGSYITLAPAGADLSGLHTALERAGMDTNTRIHRGDLRRRFGNTCKSMQCRAIPMQCTHFEEAVDSLLDAHAATFLATGSPWLYEGSWMTDEELADQASRAHRAGLAAVAFYLTDDTGAPVSLEASIEAAAHAVPRPDGASVKSSHARYETADPQRLLELGFDIVVPFSTDATFEILPSGPDARGINTSQAVVVGDLHGCAETFFTRMLPAMGTDRDLSNPDVLVISVGDIHDKGPDPQGSVELIRWWLWALRTGRALMVDSNHNRRLVRYLSGDRDGWYVSPGLADTLDAIDAQPDAPELKAQIVAAFSRLPSHLWFDDLVVVHAGITERLLGATAARARGFMLHVRNRTRPWEWTGQQTLVHGHDPVEAPHTRRAEPTPESPTPGVVFNIDTGAYKGGLMSAYRHSDASTFSVAPLPHEVLTETGDDYSDSLDDDIDVAA